MHKLNVLILGSSSFINTLNELKTHLKFNPLSAGSKNYHDAILFQDEVLKDKKQNNIIMSSSAIKICVSKKKEKLSIYDSSIELPSTLKEINSVVENIAAKKKFSKNSSIEIKGYLLDKNEKKLSKFQDHIILTEKEIQLLEIFLKSRKPVTKNEILSSVWKYVAETDTHTVETHIYRLRKKISDKFMDEKFIINNKNGYSL